MISSKYWHTRFMTDPAVVGKTMRVNNVVVTVVGVIAPEFTGIQQPVSELPDIGLPLSLEPQLNTLGAARLGQPTYWWLQVMGRLKPGATAAQVQGNLEGVFQHTARAGLDSYMKWLTETERGTAMNRTRTEVPHLRVDSGSRGIYDVNTTNLRAATILGVVVALVLLIVCANVANLLLSRAATRQKELSVRLSLGATRLRLIRQLLTESLLLAAVGGALGVLVGYWGKQLLPGPTGQAPLLDWRVLAFVLAVTGLTGIVFGIAPALGATGGDVNAALKQSSRSVAGSRSVLGKSLLVAQVAISLVLLVGAGLFLRTLHNLRHVDVGFNPQNLLLFRVQPQLNRYDEKRTAALYGQLLERIAAVPGVRAAALTNPALLTGSVNSTGIFVRGPRLRERARQRDQHQSSRDLAELLRRHGDSDPARPGLHPARQRGGPEGRGDQRRRREEVFPEREPDRPALRLERREQQPARGRRHHPRREVQQRPRRRAADDVRAVPADARGLRDHRRADRRRSRHRNGQRAGSRQAGRLESSDGGRLDAARTGRAPVRAGEAVRAGVRLVRRARAAARGDRAVRPDVLQRVAPHERNRHPDGARRAARPRAGPGDARIDDSGRRRRRHRRRGGDWG